MLGLRNHVLRAKIQMQTEKYAGERTDAGTASETRNGRLSWKQTSRTKLSRHKRQDKSKPETSRTESIGRKGMFKKTRKLLALVLSITMILTAALRAGNQPPRIRRRPRDRIRKTQRTPPRSRTQSQPVTAKKAAKKGSTN